MFTGRNNHGLAQDQCVVSAREYINSVINHPITSGRGLAQEGSLRAENKEKDESNAAFDEFVSRDRVIVFESLQHRKANSFNRARFALDTCPRADTSKEK